MAALIFSVQSGNTFLYSGSAVRAHFGLFVFVLGVNEEFVEAVHFGFDVLQVLLLAGFGFAELFVFLGFFLGIKSLLCPLLLQAFCGTFKLNVFLEAHHVLDVVANDLGEHVLFEQFAGLHCIEEEILAQLLGQVGFDDFVHLLLRCSTLCRSGGRAINKMASVHVERNALYGFSCGVELVGAPKHILLWAGKYHTHKSNFKDDFRV